MLLVERHIIKQNHKWFREIDQMSFFSKNLFNRAVYLCRQAFFSSQPIPKFNQIYHSLKNSDDYKTLPSKVAQLVFKQVDKCVKSYQEAKKEYQLNPGKFLGEPKLPKYKQKQKGRNVLTFNNQAVSQKSLEQSLISPSGLPICIKTKLTQIEEVRIIPKNNVYIIEAVYELEVTTKVQITEESYTSKCSFLDFEPIKKHEQYLGNRVKRGLFKSKLGKTYSADLNGSLNILRKVVGDSIFDRNSIERLVVSPVRFRPYQARNI